MFIHKHPYPPFIDNDCTRLIVGTLPPPRFSTGILKPGDVEFCYGSVDGLLWKILDRIYKLELDYETTEKAVKQRKRFLKEQKIGVFDIVASCERSKINASDLGMQNIVNRDIVSMLRTYTKVHTLLLTGGNSKNGPEYHLRRVLKKSGIRLIPVNLKTPRIHEFEVDKGRMIRSVSLTAPTGTANIAIGSNPEYKRLKRLNPEFNTFEFRVLQYGKYFQNCLSE